MEQRRGQNDARVPKKPHSIPTVSRVERDGRLVELVYEPEVERTRFAVWRNGESTLEDRITTSKQTVLVPFAPENSLIKHAVVLLPSEPTPYGTVAALVEEIEAFIHRYVDVSPVFERIAAYYVLLSWVYDAFNEVPYLRVRGNYGSGKTRFLLTVGAICCKPLFASGASTISPIFHALDSFRGTLVIDEADFRFSDEKAEMVKILNNGNVRGLPVLRSEVTPTKEFSPRAFNVFGPKIVATRGHYDDPALESRFLTEETSHTKMRSDVPISLPDAFHEEALALRNKLLRYRFESFSGAEIDKSAVDPDIEPRLNQILAPLLAVVEDKHHREAIKAFGRSCNQERLEDRGMATEAQVLEVIRDLLVNADHPDLALKDITALFCDRFGGHYDHKVTVRWVGSIVRKRLFLKPVKTRGVYVLPLGERPKLSRLLERYGVGDYAVDEPTFTWEPVEQDGDAPAPQQDIQM